MKWIVPVLLIVAVIYLNRAYALYYNSIIDHKLQAPVTPKNLTLGNSKLNTINYVALGASLTAGVGSTSYKNTYPYILATQLSKESTVHLTNLGIPGATSEDVLNTEMKEVKSLTPTLVTVMIGINDIHNLKSPDEFENNLSEIIQELKNQGNPQIVLINIPVLGSSKILLFPYNYLLDFRTRQFNDVFTKMSKQYNLKLIDLYDFSLSNFSDQDYSKDQFHPSDQGYKLWSEDIDAN